METLSYFELSALKSAPSIEGWQDFLEAGNGYLNTATAAHNRQVGTFTSAILYNIIAMAIEKFVMAALMHHGDLPYNHTMTDLVDAMETIFPGQLGDIRNSLIQLDRYQEICDLEGFSISPPPMEEIPIMLYLAKRVQTLVKNLVQ